MKKAHGFTLIEILVVLFIISIVSTVALLSISRNSNKQIETFANELAQTITLAEEQALLQPAVIGVRVKNDVVEFSAYHPPVPAEKNKTASWELIQDDVLGKHAIPSSVAVKVEMANAHPSDSAENEEKQQPQIIISTNGDVTPFTIYVGKQDEKPRYVIKGEADGTITVKPLQ